MPIQLLSVTAGNPNSSIRGCVSETVARSEVAESPKLFGPHIPFAIRLIAKELTQ